MSSLRRVLIVSPNFPPLNAPDHQRVRHCLPYLAEFGWEATVLCLDPEEAEGVHDPDLVRTIPAETTVVRTGAIPRKFTKCFGLGSMALRALPNITTRGGRILRERKHDLVFFSTTAFPVMAAGVVWKKRFGVPYVLDFQDPWRNDFYDRPGAPVPPGGRFKYRMLARPVAALLEPRAVRNASGIVCVSEEYSRKLSRRYDVEPRKFITLPFAASEADIELARTSAISQDIFDPQDGLQHWVSTGAATPAYAPLIRMLFEAFAEMRRKHPAACEKVRFHFVGTSYARDPEKRGTTVRDLAAAAGMEDIVEEHAGRIPYLAALKAMSESDVVLAIGNTDASHTASKIYPAVLSRRPLLAFYHESSSALRILEDCSAGYRVAWHPDDEGATRQAVERALEQVLLLDGGEAEYDKGAFSVYTSKEMTRRLCRSFESALGEDR